MFYVEDYINWYYNNLIGLLVDIGVIFYIVIINIFKRVDGNFKLIEYCMELVDGMKIMNIVVKWGDVEVILKDVNGRYVKIVLKDVLFIFLYF